MRAESASSDELLLGSSNLTVPDMPPPVATYTRANIHRYVAPRNTNVAMCNMMGVHSAA